MNLKGKDLISFEVLSITVHMLQAGGERVLHLFLCHLAVPAVVSKTENGKCFIKVEPGHPWGLQSALCVCIYMYVCVYIFVCISPPLQFQPLSFFFFFLRFIYFWLLWVFVAARLYLVVVSGGYSSLQCVGFSLRWFLTWSTGSRVLKLSSCSSRA